MGISARTLGDEMTIRKILTAAVAAAAIGFATCGSAAAPPPSCGGHVQLKRTGSDIRVTGTDLRVFMPSGSYGISYTYEAGGESHGGYNVSAGDGMRYSFTSADSRPQTFRVVIFNRSKSLEYCVGNYRK